MFSPSLFSGDFHDLWLQNQSSSGGLSLKGFVEMNGTQDEQKRDQLRHLFAPPLLAYSVECPGPNISQLDYIMKTRSLNGGSLNASNQNFLTPSVLKKLNKLNSIRNIGYTTISPVGIDKTMVELAYEESKQLHFSDQMDDEEGEDGEEDPSFIPTVENTNNSILEQPEEVDLDAYIPDADEFELGGTEDVIEEESLVDEDEGFMAEEVEYQEDHSISADITRHMAPLSGSGSILTAIQREGNTSEIGDENAENDNENDGESDNENNNEYDELDMIIE